MSDSSESEGMTLAQKAKAASQASPGRRRLAAGAMADASDAEDSSSSSSSSSDSSSDDEDDVPLAKRVPKQAGAHWGSIVQRFLQHATALRSRAARHICKPAASMVPRERWFAFLGV